MISPRDYIFFCTLLLMSAIVISNWSLYNRCKDPLNWWLIVDYCLFFLFRLFQIWFLETISRLRSGWWLCIPRVLAVFNLCVMYPFIWFWCVLGSVWFSRSKDCLPESASGSGYLTWIVFSFLYLLTYGALLMTIVRDRALEVNSVERLQAYLLQYQEFNVYGSLPEGLTQEEISDLPTRHVTTSETDVTCSICLNDMVADEEVRVIDCHHLFHKSCLDQWLHVKNTCPNCVRPVSTSSTWLVSSSV